MKNVKGTEIAEALKKKKDAVRQTKEESNPNKIVDGQYLGLPYKGKNKLYKNSDPKKYQPFKVASSYVNVFHTDIEEDKVALEKVYNNVSKGLMQIEEKRIEYNPTRENWDILLIYFEPYYTDPQNANEKEI